MANKKDRIMDLMRRGIISEEEAVELLEKAGDFKDEAGQAQSNEADKKFKFDFDFKGDKAKSDSPDKDGYMNHNVDFTDSMKYTFGNLFEKGKEVFKGVAKTVDDNIDFGNGFPKVKSVEKTIEKDIEGEFSAVNVDVKGGKITVKPGENAHVKADYKIYGSVENDDFDAYLAEKTKLEVVDGVLQVTTSGRIAAEIALYLPEKTYDKATLNVLNGEINAEKLAATEIEVNQLNGDITLEELTSDKVAVATKNGEVKVLKGRTSTLSIDGINGNFRVTSDFEKADLNLVNGNVLVTESFDGARTLNVKNVNGDIKVSVPESLGLVGHVKTIFGAYKTRLKLDNPFETGRNGAAVVRSGENSLTFELETKSGTIWLKDAD